MHPIKYILCFLWVHHSLASYKTLLSEWGYIQIYPLGLYVSIYSKFKSSVW